MSCSHTTMIDMVQPASARVLVTELSGSGQINPTPAEKACEDTKTALELCLSPEKLESMCGTWDLSGVTSLEFSINTQENSLGNIGAFLPNLVQLKLNKSVIMSVRELGMSLPHLQVLWMCRCCLCDLDGIFNFTALKELYVAYNHVSDLNHVGMLENLQLLDLEGNDVEDLVQIQYLGLCRKLQTLTLEGNPVCVRPAATAPQTADYKYRAAVRELLPQLCYLDNLSVEEEEEEEEKEDRTICSSIMGTEWDVLRNIIRDCASTLSAAEDSVETVESVGTYSRPSSAWPLDWPLPSTPSTGSRPTSATESASRPGSADSYRVSVDDTSFLTHGAGKILFCGNPVQALRAKHEKLRTAPTKSTFTPRDLPIHVPEHTYDTEEPYVRDRSDVIADLKSWREKHSRRLQAIETERLPQILSIQHSNLAEADDDDDDYNDEDNHGDIESDSNDGEKQHDNLNKTPDLSCPSLSPDLCHREALIPDIAKLSLSPDVRLSPSPPVQAEAVPPSGVPKPHSIRARRLRQSLVHLEQLPNSNKEVCSLKTAATVGDTHLLLPRVCSVTRTNIHIPNLPSASEGSIDSGLDMELPCQHRHPPQLPKLRDKLAMSRPHTARAALQIHQQHHFHWTHSGSSQQH